MILYMENRKDSTQKTTRTDKEIQQSSSIQDKHTEICAFLYTKNEIEKESKKKQKQKKISSKSYLRIHLTKEVKDLYSKPHTYDLHVANFQRCEHAFTYPIM